MKKFRFEGCRAVVTGAGSGLGREIAKEIVRRGGRVVVSDLRAEAAEETVSEIHAETGNGSRRAFAIGCDVTRPDSVETLAEFAEGNLGGVDLVVNNAGVAAGGRVGEVSLDDWHFAVNVNLWGVIHGCHTFVPRLRRQGSGAILNVASAAGLLSSPELGPYNVTKAGVVALSETLHAELRAEGVHVTVLCPTFFKTNLLDTARGGVAEELAAVRGMMEASKLQAPEVAKAALDAVARNELYAVPMWDGWVLWAVKRAAPGLFPRLLAFARKRLVPATTRPAPSAADS